MEGHRLIIKRKIPRGRERLVAVFVGGLAITGLIMLGQLKTTLSARALVSVKSDLTNMRTQFDSPLLASPQVGGVATQTPADTSVDKLKKLIQDASVKP
ncbi:MAG: hypothetical protein WC802_03565 [Patescibacteria group bacterium]|jgi:hypothetical protein